jgi:hypothetical protein
MSGRGRPHGGRSSTTSAASSEKGGGRSASSNHSSPSASPGPAGKYSSRRGGGGGGGGGTVGGTGSRGSSPSSRGRSGSLGGRPPHTPRSSPTKRQTSADSPDPKENKEESASSSSSSSTRKRKLRRPNFQNNPPAPEIVEKTDHLASRLLQEEVEAKTEADETEAAVAAEVSSSMRLNNCDTTKSNGHIEDEKKQSRKRPLEESGSSGEVKKEDEDDSDEVKKAKRSSISETKKSSSESKKSSSESPSEVEVVSKVVGDLVKEVSDIKDTDKADSKETTASSEPPVLAAAAATDNGSGEVSNDDIEPCKPGSAASAKAFRERALARILRQNLNKAVNRAEESSYDELKKKMKVILLSAVVKSRSETEEAGHDLLQESYTFAAPAAVDNDAAAATDGDESSSAAESGTDDDAASARTEEAVVRKVLEEFLDTSKHSKELLESAEAGGLVRELLSALRNEMVKERKLAAKKRKKARQKSLSSLAAAASASIVLTEEETEVLLLTGGGSESKPEVVSEGKMSEVVQLSDLPPDMVPVSAAVIDVMPGDEATIVLESSSSAKSGKFAGGKPIDKSKLFSQMEDKFAKETHNALKNKPVYRRRTNNSASAASDSGDGQLQIWSPPKSPAAGTKAAATSTSTSEAAAKEESNEKFLAFNEPGEVKEDTEEEIPTLVKSSDEEKSDPPFNDSGPPQLTRQVPSQNASDSDEQNKSEKDVSAEDASSAPVLKPTEVTVTEKDAASSVKEDESSESLPPPDSPVKKSSGSSSSSDLTKSLRKVRVRRSRNSSTVGAEQSNSDGNSSADNAISDHINPVVSMPDISKSVELASVVAAETQLIAKVSSSSYATATSPTGSRLIRPKLLISATATSKSATSPSASSSSASEPLQIEIPKSKVKVPIKQGGSTTTSGSGSGPLLIEKNRVAGTGGLHYARQQQRHRVYEFTEEEEFSNMSSCVLANADAESISHAVVGALAPKPLVVNGAVKQPEHKPLKTVIRLPGSGGGQKQQQPVAAVAAVSVVAPATKKANNGYDGGEEQQKRKRGRPPGSGTKENRENNANANAGGRNSASPVELVEPAEAAVLAAAEAVADRLTPVSIADKEDIMVNASSGGDKSDEKLSVVAE